ncbi:YciI family protein [Parasalinivibrio latis]|uniref:YciI family protein n=1 Tax=Parasalinivibrio latis TaxID=2952610 RepID=UPI0030E2F7E6
MTTKTYLCIQRSDGGNCEPPSPSDMEKMYANFMAWKEKFSDNIVDMGGKLASGGKLVRHGGAVTDGPYMETKEIIGGFMIISAENYEEAEQVVLESPGVAGSGTSVEIREIQTQ